MGTVQPNKSTDEQRGRSFFRHYVAEELMFIFGVLVSLVLPVLLYFLATKSFLRFHLWSTLAGAFVLIELIGVVFVRIADLTSRENRDVILLKEQLAEIYLSALKKSALNPKLESSTSHE